MHNVKLNYKNSAITRISIIVPPAEGRHQTMRKSSFSGVRTRAREDGATWMSTIREYDALKRLIAATGRLEKKVVGVLL